uniref:OCRE domain-containing protein n=1 Tax=Elaeophora elaphi TaxID=1147741 RepID=A0A0R3S082_9BILA
MHRQETYRSRGNTQNRNLLSQPNGNNNDGVATLIRGTSDDDRRRKRFRQRVNKKNLNASIASNSSCRTAEKSDTNSEIIQQEQKQQETTVDGKMMKTPNEFKDAYWYYDPKTDGFYYDSKGSRGWRRRNPAHEKKQLQERDGLSYLWADPNLVAYGGGDPYGYQYNSINHFSPHIQYYDPETDGYYFEMPSVDGWKKRQPHSISTTVMPSLTGFCSSRMMMSPNALPAVSTQPSVTDAMDVPRTSYGAALARGQLPPCTIRTNNAITSTSTNINGVLKDTFPSAELSFSTLSSNDDFGAASLVMLFDKTSKEWDKKGNSQGNCNTQKPFSYADIVASPCDTSTNTNVDDIENSPPPPQQIMDAHYKRPETLELHCFTEENDVGRATNEQDRKRSELTNFNADKFIADLPFNSMDRVLRDLAALKTPCSVPICSLDSPHTPSSVVKGLNQDISSYSSAICDMELVLSQILSCADEKEWVPERASVGTSKLNLWRNSGLVAGVAGVSCDNV